MKKRISKKGFTLVELLAVIVILAIVLIIAVPGVLSIIDNSRKDALMSTAKTIKDATRLFVTTSDDAAVSDGQTVWIPLSCIEADISENGYGKTINQDTSFIAVKNTANQFSYKANLNSGDGEMTVNANEEISDLTRAEVKKSTDFTGESAPKLFSTTAPSGTLKVDPATCKLAVPTT